MSKEHLETIKKVKEYMLKENYEGLNEYIKMREQEEKQDRASVYIDDLVNELK